MQGGSARYTQHGRLGPLKTLACLPTHVPIHLCCVDVSHPPIPTSLIDDDASALTWQGKIPRLQAWDSQIYALHSCCKAQILVKNQPIMWWCTDVGHWALRRRWRGDPNPEPSTNRFIRFPLVHQTGPSTGHLCFFTAGPPGASHRPSVRVCCVITEVPSSLFPRGTHAQPLKPLPVTRAPTLYILQVCLQMDHLVLGPAMALCSGCGHRDMARSMKRCARCKLSLYCSKECQTAAWPSHKSLCKEAVKISNSGCGCWAQLWAHGAQLRARPRMLRVLRPRGGAAAPLAGKSRRCWLRWGLNVTHFA